MNSVNELVGNKPSIPQCQYFVVRKKRLCRMTVRPGKQYCGEHEPQPKTEGGEVDKRIPCPNDPKHTCYASKLQHHLAICNARQTDLPPYIIHDINCPAETSSFVRTPLGSISREDLQQLIDKVNVLYDKHVKGKIEVIPERPIHHTVIDEFSESNRGETSLRHLRQASSLLWIMETEGLVQDRTCYVELGAGKGQLSFYACRAWCEGPEDSSSSRSCVVLVDRASLRHKRDNKLARNHLRIRADLRHLALEKVEVVQENKHVVGFAKHLCGVATDYALRCITSATVSARCRGVVMATCCHHRCEQPEYVGWQHLQDLGVNEKEMNIMLGVVSWATCGDGRSRETRKQQHLDKTGTQQGNQQRNTETNPTPGPGPGPGPAGTKDQFTQEFREKIGRNTKALFDWGRVLYLRDKGFDARLCYYVPTAVSLENVCIVAKKLS